MNFNSRETYLAAVSAWKIAYNEHTLKARADKLIFKEAQRSFARCDATTGWVEQSRQLDAAWRQIRVNTLRAQEMVSERHASKEEAARQMEAKHIAMSPALE